MLRPIVGIFSGLPLLTAVPLLIALIAGPHPAQNGRTAVSETKSGASRPAVADRPTSASRPAKSAEASYVRFVGRGNDERLETAWRAFARNDGRIVVLIGAVHVADPDYYAALDVLLGRADYVLYEGVSGEPTADMTTIARLQLSLGRMLDLTFQKDGIRYGRPHFIHADLDAAEIERRLKARGESLLPGGAAFKMLGPMFAGALEQAAAEAERARQAGRPSAFAGVKRLAAKLLSDPERTRNVRSRGFDEVVIGSRNERTMEVLAPLLDQGPGAYAVFYGAAHLADFERRLTELGFQGGAFRWLPAWRIGKDAPAPAPTADDALSDFGFRAGPL